MQALEISDFYIMTFLLFFLFIIGAVAVDLNSLKFRIQQVREKFMKKRKKNLNFPSHFSKKQFKK